MTDARVAVAKFAQFEPYGGSGGLATALLPATSFGEGPVRPSPPWRPSDGHGLGGFAGIKAEAIGAAGETAQQWPLALLPQCFVTGASVLVNFAPLINANSLFYRNFGYFVGAGPGLAARADGLLRQPLQGSFLNWPLETVGVAWPLGRRRGFASGINASQRSTGEGVENCLETNAPLASAMGRMGWLEQNLGPSRPFQDGMPRVALH